MHNILLRCAWSHVGCGNVLGALLSLAERLCHNGLADVVGLCGARASARSGASCLAFG